jgi:hypothetical protein
MLDHFHGRSTLLDRGAALGWNHVVDVSRNNGVTGQVSPREDNTGAGIGRSEAKLNIRSVEKPNPTDLRRVGERAL